ncbi:MAG: DoxX family protein [Weeksellaceae bacterium]|jgi:putative oxidoreductase|nr:DoxX family protein [Weeksellaceae bacterium]
MKNHHTGILILRLGVGILMLLHGTAKITKGVGGIQNMLVDSNLPKVISYGVYFGEILAPILLIIGFRTRIAALLVALTMLTAIFLANIDKVAQLTNSGGWAIELQVLFIVGSLALFFTGGGKYALSDKNKWD